MIYFQKKIIHKYTKLKIFPYLSPIKKKADFENFQNRQLYLLDILAFQTHYCFQQGVSCLNCF